MVERPRDVHEPKPRHVATEHGKRAAVRRPRHLTTRIAVPDSIQAADQRAVASLSLPPANSVTPRAVGKRRIATKSLHRSIPSLYSFCSHVKTLLLRIQALRQAA